MTGEFPVMPPGSPSTWKTIRNVAVVLSGFRMLVQCFSAGEEGKVTHHASPMSFTVVRAP